ncbi:ABC transporter permease [Mycobacterium paraterrae]|uniref:ABC transporter permease n=1 Tax=Mycobacterium paraterrae TaxID=577492 RepID=A0ABY3VMY7_9MYCO|nr:ABC transporter permease [Mycobacterium paraterrae]UMB69515.1 ABC transporter permease [Mycobacterium paraterrae]
MRLRAKAFRHDPGWASAIEQIVATVDGVRAVQAYPRTASVVVWYEPGSCDTAAVVSAIAEAQDVAVASTGTPTSPYLGAGHRGGLLSKIVGGLAQSLLIPERDDSDPPPEIERLRAALDRIGYYPAPAAAAARPPLVGQLKRIPIRPRWTWLALPLGLAAVSFTGLGLRSLRRWAAVSGVRAARSQPVGRRSPLRLAAMATTALAVPSWGGVVVALLLVGVAGAIAYRQRLGLTREIAVAGARAAVQLLTAGALLRIVFQRPSLLGPFGWLIGMIVIAGQVAGRRSSGLPGARVAATSGVAASTVVTLGTLLAGRVIAAQGRVIVPVGGMIVSSAMLAAGSSLRRLDAELRQSRPAVEARLSLGQSGREAILPYQRSALRTALIPAIDSTKVVGLISLPGAMTGLILAGVSPLTAIRYQIVVMYMQLAATAVSALVTVRVAEGSILDDAHRLIQPDPLDEPS